MISPLNEPMTEEKAREILLADHHGPLEWIAKGFLKGVESERAKHLERVEQEKGPTDNETMELQAAQLRAFLQENLKMKVALEAADRIASLLSAVTGVTGDCLDTTIEHRVILKQADLAAYGEALEAYRAARAKVGG